VGCGTGRAAPYRQLEVGGRLNPPNRVPLGEAGTVKSCRKANLFPFPVKDSRGKLDARAHKE